MRWRQLNVYKPTPGYEAYESKGAGNLYVVEFAPRFGYRASWTNRRAPRPDGTVRPVVQPLGGVFPSLGAALVACETHKKDFRK